MTDTGTRPGTARDAGPGGDALGGRLAAWLVDAAPRWFGTEPASWEVVRAMRGAEYKLVPTYLAATRLAGAELSDAAAAEVATTRARQERYLALADGLLARHPDLRLVKGPIVVRRYPSGLVRHLGDLDLTLPTEEQVHAFAGELIGQGWTCSTLTLLRARGQRHLLLTLVRPAEHDDQPIYGVQIGTLELYGNPLGVAPVRRVPTEDELTRSLLSLVAERVERPFELRDLLDAQVLLHGATPAQSAELGRLIRLAGLAPEARELQGLLDRFAPGAPALPAVPTLPARARRAATVAAGLRRPRALAGRVLQYAVVFRSVGAGVPALLRALAERTPADAAHEGGWMLWGVPLDGTARGRAAAELPRDVLATPGGDWVLTGSPVMPPRIERVLAADPGR